MAEDHPLPNYDSPGPPGTFTLDPPPARPLETEGMRVLLEPIPDLTKPGLLTQRGLLFQCPPLDEFSTDYAHSHTDYETISSQHSRKGVPQLAALTFDTLVVDWGSFVVDDETDAIAKTTALLKKICRSGTPFLLSAWHDGPSWDAAPFGVEVQFPATLRSLRVTEKAGEGDARYLNVAFTEYSDTTISRRGLGKSRANANKLPTTVRLYWDGHAQDKAGHKLADPPQHPLTLSYLARHFYKDPSLALSIGKANDLASYGATDALIKHPRFAKLKKGKFAKLKIPKKATRPRARSADEED